MLTWLFSEKSLLVALVSDWIIRMGNCSSSGAKIYQELSSICFLDCFLNVVDLSFFCCSSMCRTQWKWETSWAAGHCWTGKYLALNSFILYLHCTSAKIFFFVILRKHLMSWWNHFVKRRIFKTFRSWTSCAFEPVPTDISRSQKPLVSETLVVIPVTFK